MAHASARAHEGSVHLILAVLGVAAAAWIAVIAFHARLMLTPEDEALAAIPAGIRQLLAYCGGSPDMTGPGFGNWMVGWTLMVLAMMLPPVLPLLRAADRLLQGRRQRSALMALMLAAFVGVWVVAGCLLFAAGSALREAFGTLPDGFAPQARIAAGIAAVAVGAFQFTPLKMACMDACRSPAAVMMVDWRDAMPFRSSAHIGSRYGMICVGCCWAMMMLALLVGTLMLPIMVACALMMTAERLLPAFRPLLPVQAGFAIGIGVLLLSGIVPPAFI